MKKLIYLFLLLTTCLVACQKYCRNKDCGHGTCASNKAADGCICEDNYIKDAEGSCSLEARSALVGTWRGNHLNSAFYTVTITAVDFDISKIKIDNYFDKACATGDRLQVYAQMTSDATGAIVNTSLCTEYPDAYGTITIIDPTHIRIEGSLNFNSYEGVYERQ